MCDLERDCYQQNTCDLGRELLEWNDIILNHLTQLKEQREELDFIIKKQQDELERLKQELEEKTKLSARVWGGLICLCLFCNCFQFYSLERIAKECWNL